MTGAGSETKQRMQDLERAIKLFDRLYLTPAGTIDLLEMSRSLPGPEFARYVELSREYRGLRKEYASAG